jgi:hypothetical protein
MPMIQLDDRLPLLLAVLVSAAIALRWLARWRDLRLSVFRPYRGDPWPIGVQEEDGVRFDWSGTASAPDAPAASVPLARLDAAHVRRRGT